MEIFHFGALKLGVNSTNPVWVPRGLVVAVDLSGALLGEHFLGFLMLGVVSLLTGRLVTCWVILLVFSGSKLILAITCCNREAV